MVEISKKFYHDVSEIAKEEYNRITSENRLSAENKERIHMECIACAAIVCYHHELRAALLEHGIDIGNGRRSSLHSEDN